MTDPVPAVALLFDDSELGGHLRDALHERGAQIVHEGGVSSLSRELLDRVGADVLVINLDDSADDALDHLYEVIDGDHPRVVFNDAQASRSLEGWDRARWARHLAVKVLAAGDIDPPRPSGALAVEPPVVVVPEETVSEVPEADDAAPAEPLEEAVAGAQGDAEVEADQPIVADAPIDLHGQDAEAESESLAAELEALLASGDLPEDEESVPGLRFTDGEDPPPLHDGNFGAVEDEAHAPPLSEPTAAVPELDRPETSSPEATEDGLQLSPVDETAVAAIPASTLPTGVTDPPAVHAPQGWALVDDDASEVTRDPEEVVDPATFGIEKMSAADFLAPDVEAVADDVQPKMSLELMSMEEAVAPQPYVHDHEMVLDELGSALSRLVLLGAATDGIDSVCAFLSALPPTTRLTFLLTQHLGKQSDASLVAEYAANCSLPVRLAQGQRAEVGEVLLVPAGHQVRLRRDGSIELLVNDADAGPEPSIDASLTMAATAFGRDAVAIVFAGRGNDAVAGAQAIHDRGGQVWVEASSGDHFADMVSGIFAERLVSFSGTPTELAARLLEVFP
ncbi:MAG TPA: chemotaxis protein CheB [Rhodanobacter sp.]